MDELIKVSNEAVQRYFTALTQFGYKKYSDVNNLLVLLFLEEVLYYDFSEFITEQDYKAITNALYCLYGSNCMITFPSFINYNSLVHKNKSELIPRISQDRIIRYISEGSIRIEE